MTEQKPLGKCEYCTKYVYEYEDYDSAPNGGLIEMDSLGFPQCTYDTIYWHRKCMEDVKVGDDPFIKDISKKARAEEIKEMERIQKEKLEGGKR